MHSGISHSMMRWRLQSSPVFVATLIVEADSVGVACEYKTFISEKTLADQILTNFYIILLQTHSSYGADPHMNHPR